MHPHRENQTLKKNDNKRDIESENEEEQVDTGHLGWLWRRIVQPVRLNACSAFEKPHIWWISSGIAGSFPFYAASSLNVPSETVLNRLISSYTPTIKALAYPRVSLSAQKSFTTNYPSILVVTMPSTPGQGELKGVSREKDAIEKSCKAVCSFKELRLPSAERVLVEIPRANITHFACHGISDLSNPSSSHLLL
jgi:CHAT domain